MMEAVKIGGRLDLVECLLAAGARLDVQVRMPESLFVSGLDSHNRTLCLPDSSCSSLVEGFLRYRSLRQLRQ